MATTIQLRRDTAANWSSLNHTLASGEVGVETNTGNFKIGDGATAWNSLAYAGGASGLDTRYLKLTGGTLTGAVSGTAATWSGEAKAADFSVTGLTGAGTISRYVGSTVSGAPVSGAFNTGDWITDQTPSIWLCTAGGSPGTWTQIGALAKGTAGGDLTGTYPNPTVATGAITSAKILDGTIVDADINASAAINPTKLNRAQTETTKFTDATYTSQIVQPILSGTFVPKNTSGWLSTNITGQVRGAAFAAFDAYWGTPAQPIYVGHQGDAPAAGVNFYRIGDINPDVIGTVSKSKLLTGLTPGSTYNWSIMLGITGGSGTDSPVGTTPWWCVPSPDARRLYVSNNADNTVHVINLGGNQGLTAENGLSFLDSFAGIVPVGTGPQGMAVTPDGTKLVVCNANSANVTVINTADLSIQGTYTMPGTTPIPARAVCTSNTTAYITDYNNSKLYPFTIATGVYGTAVTVGANPLGVAVTPDGTRLGVANNGGTVSILNTPFTAVSTTVTPAGTVSPGPEEIAAMPDSSAFWITLVNNPGGTPGARRVQEILVPSNTLGVMSELFTDTGPFGIAIDPDGVSAWIGCTNGAAVQVRTSGPYKGDIYVRATIGTLCRGVAIDKFGFIYIVDSSNNRIWKYPGSQVLIFDTNSSTAKFANEDCTVTWQDA